jgi:hypothetical protein
MKFVLDQRLHAEQDIAVDVVEEIEQGEQGKRQPWTQVLLVHMAFLASSVNRATGLRTRPARLDHRANSAAGTEIALHNRPFRSGRSDDVFEHPIDDILLEDPQIAIAVQVLFKRFQLQTVLLRHVSNGDHAEIREAGLGTHRGKFRHVDDDLICRKLIGPDLNIRKIEIQT